jgi:hypothetical protein
MAVAVADPQALTRRTVPIYGRPVLAVVDVSGSMGYVGARGEDLSGFEKAREVLYEVLEGDLEADFGLLLFSSENYLARYFAPKRELLRDSLDVSEEVREISFGTEISSALAEARRFLAERSSAKDKALLLISDLQEGPAGTARTSEELERILKAGVKVYVVHMSQTALNTTPDEQAKRPIDLPGLQIVDMTDHFGIARIRAEIARMASSPLREQTILTKTSLAPYLVPPLLALLTLSLILSETCFRRLP